MIILDILEYGWGILLWIGIIGCLIEMVAGMIALAKGDPRPIDRYCDMGRWNGER